MLIRQLLNKNLAFAVYRLPDEKEPVFMIQDSDDVRQFPLENIEQQKGFVIAPFYAYKTGKAFLINPAITARNEEERKYLQVLLAGFPDKEPLLPTDSNLITDKKTYLQQADRFISKIKNGEARKVVLSRVIAQLIPQDFNFERFFEILRESYSNAFVYLFYLPGKGIWAGATPETLLRHNNGFFETMALAGTQKRTSGDKPIVWAEKEKEEQAFVTEFVEKQIKNSGIETYEKQAPETVFAGTLAHICTRFRLPAKVLQGKTGRFVQALHPTPAVCGLPKEKAWQLINETEKHERHFYTGFLGPWQVENMSHLFVNLRCARFLKNKFEIYVGGGLTAASIPEKEWQETEDKSATLLSVVEKMRNFAP